MIKILMDKTLLSDLDKTKSFLERADVKLFSAATNDELLSLHREAKMNLIIARLDAPGMSVELLSAQIRNDASLREAALILCCPNQLDQMTRAQRCGPNAVMPLPVNSMLLLNKAQSLLNVPSRGSYRVLLKVVTAVDKDNVFFCRTENISVTGLLLEADRDLALGDRLTCSFFLPNAKQIVVAGEIARVLQKNRYGVQFTEISPEAVAAIDGFVKDRINAPH